MDKYIIVSPYSTTVIDKFRERQFVILVNDFDNINEILECVNRNNFLVSIQVNLNSSLSSIDFNEKWDNVPLRIVVSDLGDYLTFHKKIDLIRKLNILFYFPINKIDNFLNIQILSSLGINCGFIISDGQLLDWGKLSELLYYYMYSKSKHSIIEPFDYIIQNNNKNDIFNNFVDYNNVYFNDPDYYIHIDSEQNISLSFENSKRNIFLDIGIDNIDSAKETKQYKNIIEDRHKHFIINHPCSYCPGWRICLGKFSYCLRSSNGCIEFFTELFNSKYILNNIL